MNVRLLSSVWRMPYLSWSENYSRYSLQHHVRLLIHWLSPINSWQTPDLLQSRAICVPGVISHLEPVTAHTYNSSLCSPKNKLHNWSSLHFPRSGKELSLMILRTTSISIPYGFSIATQGRYLYFLSPVISCQKYITKKKLATINYILRNIYR